MSKAWLAALLLLTVTFIVTEPLFDFIDDEATIVNDAADPVHVTLAKYLTASGQHEHPPLYDLVLHFWLTVAGGRMRWLRIPSIAFYILGLSAIGMAVARIGSSGTSGMGRAAPWILALWPFGFHFGQVAAWYSLSFLLVGALTIFFFEFADSPNWPRLIRLLVTAAALLYTNYYGWAWLACLAIDFSIRRRDDWRSLVRWLIPSSVALALIYLPMWKPFIAEVFGVVQPPQVGKALVAEPAFCLYSLFVSESVAPWYSWIGVPLGIASVACVILSLKLCQGAARRFLIYFLILFAGMDVLGILETKRLLLIAPWLLIPIGVAVSGGNHLRVRNVLICLLAITFLSGCAGIGLRKYYAAPRWVEPWPAVASNAAAEWRKGGTIISNSPSFFLYLTYDLGLAGPDRAKFAGLLGKSLRESNIYAMDDWLAQGSPVTTEILLAKGVEFSEPGIAEQAETALTKRCEAPQVAKLYQDPGYELKERFFPGLRQPEWRVEVRKYLCRQAPH